MCQVKAYSSQEEVRRIAQLLLPNTWLRTDWSGLPRSCGLLANSQYGFRKGRSTVDSLNIFTSDIRVFFSQGKFVTGTFLDASSAYDKVQLPILGTKLHKLKVPVRLTQ
ncbi:hypothetical protein EVAR_37206_1 [Eumeta japonica]|uniref:Reverse transcriptase domain-containing protein n=1 Tax=Eumeta variegata TaxID=151549 RepID=A0A4C1Z0M2_EUMVA|nr:hypothetical protein EVAR_37206_1 [Eumeta japonica]